MSTVTIIKKRVGTDLKIKATLTDNGVSVAWSSLSDIRAFMYSDAQSVMAGVAETEIDSDDVYSLIIRYGVSEPQYLGVNRVVLQCTYMGKTRTFDAPAVEFVSLLESEGTSEATDVDTAIDITVTEVDTSLLDEAIAACIDATSKASQYADEEPERQANETARQASETARAEAEQTRQSNEATRIANENARVAAEAGRQAELDAKADQTDLDAEIERAEGAEPFKVVYGTTTYAEIKSAYDSGRLCYMVVNDRVCVCTQYSSYLYFVCVSGRGDFYVYYIDSSNTWKSGGLNFVFDKDFAAEVTRAKKAEEANATAIEKKADDTEVVHLAGKETIAGKKIFTDAVSLQEALIGGGEIDVTEVTDMNTGTRLDDYFANDNAVVHKTGEEEINGHKSFNDVVDFGDEITARAMNVNGTDVESTLNKCVKVVSQSLSTDEQTIARANIGVYSKTEVDSLIVSTINADY